MPSGLIARLTAAESVVRGLVYPGYAASQERARPRQIPVVVLEPR